MTGFTPHDNLQMRFVFAGTERLNRRKVCSMDFVHQANEMSEVVKGWRGLALSVLPSGSLCLELERGVRLTCELNITDGETSQWFEVDIQDPSEADGLYAISGQASDREGPPDR